MATRVVATNVVEPRVMLNVLTAVKRGDFSARLPVTWTGSAGRIASPMNDIIESNQRLERELRRLGQKGRQGGQGEKGGPGRARRRSGFNPHSANRLIPRPRRPTTRQAP